METDSFQVLVRDSRLIRVTPPPPPHPFLSWCNQPLGSLALILKRRPSQVINPQRTHIYRLSYCLKIHNAHLQVIYPNQEVFVAKYVYMYMYRVLFSHVQFQWKTRSFS